MDGVGAADLIGVVPVVILIIASIVAFFAVLWVLAEAVGAVAAIWDRWCNRRNSSIAYQPPPHYKQTRVNTLSFECEVCTYYRNDLGVMVTGLAGLEGGKREFAGFIEYAENDATIAAAVHDILVQDLKLSGDIPDSSLAVACAKFQKTLEGTPSLGRLHISSEIKAEYERISKKAIDLR